MMWPRPTLVRVVGVVVLMLVLGTGCGTTTDPSESAPANGTTAPIYTPPGTGGLVVSEVVVRGRGTFPVTSSCADGLAAQKRLFCYKESMPNGGTADDYLVDKTWSENCTSSWTNDEYSPNNANMTLKSAHSRIDTKHNLADPLKSISRLDRITLIGAVFFGGGAYGTASERSYKAVTASPRSRESSSYKEAIMCGARAKWGS